MHQFTARVSEHQNLASSFQYIHLELINPNKIDFLAGQYVILAIDKAKGIRRDYSIASLPSTNHAVELLIDVKPQGEGSKYLANLKPGDKIEFMGPFGSFVVKNECLNSQLPITNRQLLFVATGSGISPIRAMILDLLQTKKHQGQIRLWWGMRYQEDCFWVEDFDDLEKEYPNFEWDLVLSKPPDDWPLHRGYTTTHVLDYVQNGMKNEELRMTNDNSTFCFYLCGNQHMIDDTSTELKKIGINMEHVHTEKFF